MRRWPSAAGRIPWRRRSPRPAATLGTAAGGDSLKLNGLLTAAASNTLNKTGSGTATIAGGIDHAGAIAVQGGLLKYDLAAGKPVTIGPAATLSIASGATVELAGALSGTGAGGNYVDITNNSTAGGLLVSTANQAVGAITGSGTTSIAAGASLTADSHRAKHPADRRRRLGGDPRDHLRRRRPSRPRARRTPLAPRRPAPPGRLRLAEAARCIVTEKQLDARGLGCPQPVILARQALLSAGAGPVQVLVDDMVSVANIQRMAATLGWQAEVAAADKGMCITLTKGEAAPAAAGEPAAAVPAGRPKWSC